MTRKHDRNGWTGWPEQWAGADTNGAMSPALRELKDTLKEARRSASDLMLVAQARLLSLSEAPTRCPSTCARTAALLQQLPRQGSACTTSACQTKDRHARPAPLLSVPVLFGLLPRAAPGACVKVQVLLDWRASSRHAARGCQA